MLTSWAAEDSAVTSWLLTCTISKNLVNIPPQNIHRYTSHISTLLSQVMWLVVTEVRSKSFGLVTEHRHYNACPIYACCCYVRRGLSFIVDCGIAAISAHVCTMCIFDVWASSSPLGYPCAKFRFFRTVHCWARPRRKIAYSITQSLSQAPSLFDMLGTKAFTLEQSGFNQ